MKKQDTPITQFNDHMQKVNELNSSIADEVLALRREAVELLSSLDPHKVLWELPDSMLFKLVERLFKDRP